MVQLSKVSKLDGIKSWSLQALETCPGSLKKDGTLVDACSGCYATTGNYRYPNVKAPRAFNKQDWKRSEWVAEMVAALQNDRYFRWLDSGDLYAVELAEKVYNVMAATPWVKHWLPTRMHKFPKFANVFKKMKALDNVAVRFSSDSIDGSYIDGLHGSTIINGEAPAGVVACQAYANEGKCNGCRACWDKTVNVIGYMAHGVKMKKVIRLALAA